MRRRYHHSDGMPSRQKSPLGVACGDSRAVQWGGCDVEPLESRQLLTTSFSISVVSTLPVMEGDNGASTDVVVDIFRSGDAVEMNGWAAVSYSTADYTALAGVDYTDTYGVAVFAPTQTTYSFTVPVLGNAIVQGRREFDVAIGDPIPMTSRFGPEQDTATPFASSMVVADFNNDGLADVAGELPGQLAGVGFVGVAVNTTVPGSSTVSFAPAQFSLVGPMGVPSGLQLGNPLMLSGDFNGDGRPDLACALSGNMVSILYNQTPAGLSQVVFVGPYVYSLPDQPVGLAVGDLNADGKDDLVIMTRQNLVLVKTGSMELPCQVVYTADPATTPEAMALSAVIADLNSDGKDDVVIANRDTYELLAMLSITAPGGPIMQMGPAQATSTDGAIVQIVPADFNYDGTVDLVATESPNDPYMDLVENYTLPYSNTVDLRISYFDPPASFNSDSADVIRLTSGDFNDDGAPELATAVWGPLMYLFGANWGDVAVSQNWSSLFTGLPFDPFASIEVGRPRRTPMDIQTGDFNGDGRLDLVVRMDFLETTVEGDIWSGENTVITDSYSNAVFLNQFAPAVIGREYDTVIIADDDAPAAIVTAGGDIQSAFIDTGFDQPLSVIVKNSQGNPVEGVAVIFTNPLYLVTGHFLDGQRSATVYSDASGLAVSPPEFAGNVSGIFQVAASTENGVSVAFTLTNALRAVFPPSIHSFDASPSQALAGDILRRR